MKQVFDVLKSYKKQTLSLGTLETLLTPFVDSYESFSKMVLELELRDVLLPIKSKGRTGRQLSLALGYRLNRQRLNDTVIATLQHYRRIFHPAINLDDYYNKSKQAFEQDLEALMKIDQYLQTHGFPESEQSSPEVSFLLMHDEKWLDEQGGRELLKRVRLYDQFNIRSVADPLSMAINPHQLTASVHRHLIVENKATFHSLLPALVETNFSTLIYGQGKAILSSINLFDDQFPVGDDHQFYYFGDIDREGIYIWHLLNQKRQMVLALPFYQACLTKVQAKGKTHHQVREQALSDFLEVFDETSQHQIASALNSGYYYPQEILTTEELQTIWGESRWDSLT